MKCTRQVRHCVHSVELFVEVHDVKRHAIVDVLCRPSCQRRQSNSLPIAFFHKCFHCILTAFSVVLTPPVGYSRPPSAVNDPTVIKASEFGKIMP